MRRAVGLRASRSLAIKGKCRPSMAHPPPQGREVEDCWRWRWKVPSPDPRTKPSNRWRVLVWVRTDKRAVNSSPNDSRGFTNVGHGLLQPIRRLPGGSNHRDMKTWPYFEQRDEQNHQGAGLAGSGSLRIKSTISWLIACAIARAW